MDQNIRRRSLIALFLLAVTLLAGTAVAATPMPRFVLPSVTDGRALDSNTLKGKVLLINFWATWCPPCRKEIPSLIELQNKYGAKGFSVIGISTDQGGSSLVAKFAQKMNINYPVVLSDSDTPRNFGNILGIPTTFLVDRSGNVRKRYDGYVDHETLERDLLQIMK
ncbi:MAG: TlpA disulfide reductase family protein [Thermodesulfobacteriota bacterium]|jgi:cytochrome c biogenesis protein CcmG/thiol:disulfide interchange protein DsbE